MKKLIFIFAFLALLTQSSIATKHIPLLNQEPYDTIMGGKEVKLYTISNGHIAAQISNYGGFVIALFTPDKHGDYVNIVTNYPDIHKYPNANIGMVGPALGRYANRIANGHFTIEGKEYNITKNNGPHTLHGGTQGFDHVVWDVKKANKKELVLKCMLEDGTDGFPGTLTTTLTYSITKDNGLSISYESTTDKTTIVNLSNHTYFNLNGEGDIMNHYLTINADSITETDRSGIPTGNFIKTAGTLYDFRTPVLIGDRTATFPKGFRFGQKFEIPQDKVMSYDNNFCVNHLSKSKTEKVASLYSPESGRCMEVWNNHPGLQVYTGARKAIALESQMYPDSPNHPNFPSTILQPGKKYHHTCIYKFSVIE